MNVPQTSPAASKIAPNIASGITDDCGFSTNLTDRVDLLVRQAQGGSTIAFEQLCFIYRTRLLRTLNGITGHREDAEDALQNACLNAYLNLGTFEGRSSFGSWFTRIAINNALQLLRKRRRRPEQPLERDADSPNAFPVCDPADPAPNPEEVCRRRQQAVQMHDAISRMPARLRQVLELYLKEELPREGIAKRLAISESAAKSRLHRAKMKLLQDTAKDWSNSGPGARRPRQLS